MVLFVLEEHPLYKGGGGAREHLTVEIQQGKRQTQQACPVNLLAMMCFWF